MDSKLSQEIIDRANTLAALEKQVDDQLDEVENLLRGQPTLRSVSAAFQDGKIVEEFTPDTKVDFSLKFCFLNKDNGWCLCRQQMSMFGAWLPIRVKDLKLAYKVKVLLCLPLFVQHYNQCLAEEVQCVTESIRYMLNTVENR